ncbi:2-isopropylmalate synthase [Leeia oryzae]|uniref:2-isopropylmalate synthase n=1 Tax=Leeia oryzae TaxID=356662 RepID=UPI00036D850D|nr:2-isopropylmalate synthase [Leeia oryzae]
MHDPAFKYQPAQPIPMSDRQWPGRTITHSPLWCSTDLRDGNQALANPMDIPTKRAFFELLVKTGFKQIEVAFPSASQTDFDFVRQLITGQAIPEDVTIEVITQAREHLIRRTFEALQGARRAIIHLYNPTAPVWRALVYQKSRAEMIRMAVEATRLCRACAQQQPETEWVFQYSPETFSATELDFSLDICHAVMEAWQPTPGQQMILNLPATVELSTPNRYADQIEWMHRHLRERESIILSVHPHNDRGTGVAAAELALLAGAERVEGCLFGNGERTGNVDLVTLALNLYTQGIAPGLDFSDIDRVRDAVERFTRLPVHPRHPYAGELVYTAFSGSHQDAIKKGFAAQTADTFWQVPYLPLDPKDVGRSYEAVIVVNSQSGKGGIAWVLEQQYGYQLPRDLQMDFAGKVQTVTDDTGQAQTADEILRLFESSYLSAHPDMTLAEGAPSWFESGELRICLQIAGQPQQLTGQGDGPLHALMDALNRHFGTQVHIRNYHEHALTTGEDAEAVAYITVSGNCQRPSFGVGRHRDIVTASWQAVLKAFAGLVLPKMIETI